MASLLLGQAQAVELVWQTDLPKALAQAKTEKKLVLLDFTGSDWCAYCKRLHRDVFSTSEFADYAKKNLVLVTVDFPRNTPQPKELKKANEALQSKYRVDGFPTLVVLNSAGKEVDRQSGYDGSGIGPVTAMIDKHRTK